MKRKLIAVTLILTLMGLTSAVAFAQQEEVIPLPIKPVLGTQMTFGLGWISYVGLDVNPLEVDFGGLTTITEEGIGLNTFGPIFKLDFYTPVKLALYGEFGFFYNFSDDTKSYLVGTGTEYLINSNLSIYGEVAFLGQQPDNGFTLNPGMTTGIKLQL